MINYVSKPHVLCGHEQKYVKAIYILAQKSEMHQ